MTEQCIHKKGSKCTLKHIKCIKKCDNFDDKKYWITIDKRW